jgi:Uma2 family endonuclease
VRAHTIVSLPVHRLAGFGYNGTMSITHQPDVIAKVPELPNFARGIPILYEDEGQEDMGESELHMLASHSLFWGLNAHLARRPELRRHQAYLNLNLYYLSNEPKEHWAYVSPDTMVAVPFRKTRAKLKSYRIGKTGPAPVLTVEVLSERSYQEQDLTEKPKIYAAIGVTEYVLVDAEGEFLPQKLLMMRLQTNRTWKSAHDPDGGITSRLGFRLIIDGDGQLRVMDAATGRPYARPQDAQAEAEARELEAEARQAEAAARQAEAEARRHAERRIEELEAELDRLRGIVRERKKNGR